MSDLKGVPKRVIVTADEAAYPTALRAYADLIVRDGIVVKHRTGTANRPATDEEIASCKVLTPGEAKIAVDASAWRGEQPAEGTRRRIVLDAISKGDVLSDTEALEIADTVELALLGSGDDEREADAQEAINAVGNALDRIDAPQGATYAERIDRLYREMREKLAIADVRHQIDKGRLVDLDRVHNLLDGWEIRRTTDENATRRSLYDRARELIERLRRTEEDLDTEQHRVVPALRDNPHLTAEQRMEFEDQLRFLDKRHGAPADPTKARLEAEASDVRGRIERGRRILAESPSWRGTQPAEGTRRGLIRDVLAGMGIKLGNGTGGYLSNETSLRLADAVEAALLEEAQDELDGEAMRRGADALTGGIVKVDPTLSLEGFCAAQKLSHHRLRAEDPGFREYHRGAETSYDVMLEWLAKHGSRTDEWVQQVIMRSIVAGQECDVPFPADVVDSVLFEFGIRPTLPRNWPPIHGRREEGDDAPEPPLREAVAEVVKGVFDQDEAGPSPRSEEEEEDRFDRLLRQREEARAGEDHWKAQRDAALGLLQWLIPDLIPNRSDV